MLLKHVVVENFGPFQGIHTLNLVHSPATEPHRPVVLIGGRNGSGKTSLLEAIRLCLHGRRALGNPRNAEYYDYLRNRIHRRTDGKRTSSSSVRVEIEVVEVGHRHTYEVNRSWKNARNVSEELNIKRDGEVLRELYVDQYQSFLNELMPLGLAEFFFFDGEYIQKLAEEDGSDSVVADSIRGLLGLHVISRLQADITILIQNRNDSPPSGEIQAEAAEAQSRLKEVKACIERLEADHCRTEMRNRNLEREVELQEQRIASEGGDFARNREDLLKNQAVWQTTLQSCEAELRELANELLPFSLVPELCVRVRQRVNKEAAARREEITTAILHSKQQELLQVLDSSAFWVETLGDRSTTAVRELAAKAVSSLMKNGTSVRSKKKLRVVHDLSEGDQQALFASIETLLTDIPQRATRLATLAEEACHRLLQIGQDLQRAPREEVLRPLLEELSSLQTMLSNARHEQTALQEKLNRARRKQEETERVIRKLGERFHGVEQTGRAMTLAARVRNVLQSYQQELTITRMGHLAKYVTECYKQLAHKESLCSHIRFDPKTLDVTLYNAQDDVVFRPLLSAGEKQVLAIAILWGLGRASGRQLPVIIDTPLARLDTSHRDRLLSRYFPNAGHQVILLSTDSEINHRGLEILKPFIAKSHYLSFDSEYGRTTIESGYFPEK